MSNIIDEYKDVSELKTMSIEKLQQFSTEIRNFLIDKVSKTGGHLASNLGVVELTLSLYSVFDFDKEDKIIWDVGHQCYVHKILTGRKDKFDTLRQYGGISGFPKSCESKFDMFNTGHSSTSISAAVGMARARDIMGENFNVVAVIGDGALTGGMAFEALNDVSYRKTRIIIILNDNQMSIARNVGGMSTYLSKLRIDPKYNKIKEDINNTLNKTHLGKGVAKSLKKITGSIKQFVVPGMLFENMGIKYLGPIDGHNIKDLKEVFSKAKSFKEPVLIHVITKKGKGYKLAEENPNKFHGIGPFDCNSGEVCADSKITYSKVFGEELVKVAEHNKNVVAITAAMRDGTGLNKFAQKFKERFFDVGIAEQHAVTMAAGMAKAGLRPVFAVYSTFLQRAYDQLLHDVCLQNLPVVLAVDRAGIVGEDGETHQGIFDISYLSHMPNMTIISPKSTDEIGVMLRWALTQNSPVAIRYPRGGDVDDISINPLKNINKGKWEYIVKGNKVAVIAAGKMIQHSIIAARKLKNIGINITVVNACFIKPIDEAMLNEICISHNNILTIEDNVLCGGLGSSILQYVNGHYSNVKVYSLGYKDEFVTHGKVNILYKLHGLDSESIAQKILNIIQDVKGDI